MAKKIQNEEDEQQQKKTSYLEGGKKTQPKKTELSNWLIHGTFRTAVTNGSCRVARPGILHPSSPADGAR